MKVNQEESERETLSITCRFYEMELGREREIRHNLANNKCIILLLLVLLQTTDPFITTFTTLEARAPHYFDIFMTNNQHAMLTILTKYRIDTVLNLIINIYRIFSLI